MGQRSFGTYKQNVTNAIMLAILISFVRKIHFQRLARLKTPLRALEASTIMSIDHYIYRLHPTLSQVSTTSHLLRKGSFILEPQFIFSQIMHTFPRTKNIIISSKPVPRKYLQHIGMEMLCYVEHIQMVQK